MKLATLQTILDHIEQKRPLVLATNLETGEERTVRRGEWKDETEQEHVLRCLRMDTCITTDEALGPRIFYQPFNPPLRMILVGAVHVAQPLSAMAALAGYEVVVVDPRTSFASIERFPGVALVHEWPDEALQALELDSRCAVVTLTHDPKLDDPALREALKSDAFFIGSLGSKKTNAGRLRRLRKAGFGEDDVARIRGPVGLPIGSRSPAEIAVAVLAQVTESLRKPGGRAS